MDLATIIGFVVGWGIIMAAIMMGGELMLFVNFPSIAVVLGGTVGALFIQFPMGQVLGSVGVALKTFVFKIDSPRSVIDLAMELAVVVRKEGLLALEGREDITDPFFKKGVDLCVDGHPPELVRKILSQDMNKSIERHELGQSFWKAMGDAAPAMGMVGTLIGLVQMLANMEDPKTIGPAMAVALLTTLYGALIANLIALPMAGKLAIRQGEEELSRRLIIETIVNIQEGVNPRVMEESLLTFLPPKQRVAADESGAEPVGEG